MRLLLKQKVFSWSDSYEIYDDNGAIKYYVKSDIFSLSHKLRVYDQNHYEIAMVREKVLKLVPVFEIEIGGMVRGSIHKKISLFSSKYEIDFNNWYIEGDYMGLEYYVYSAGYPVLNLSKQLLSWGDTYVIDIMNPIDELMGILLVIAINAADCSK